MKKKLILIGGRSLDSQAILLEHSKDPQLLLLMVQDPQRF
jgi:hypothetical protein